MSRPKVKRVKGMVVPCVVCNTPIVQESSRGPMKVHCKAKCRKVDSLRGVAAAHNLVPPDPECTCCLSYLQRIRVLEALVAELQGERSEMSSPSPPSPDTEPIEPVVLAPVAAVPQTDLPLSPLPPTAKSVQIQVSLPCSSCESQQQEVASLRAVKRNACAPLPVSPRTVCSKRRPVSNEVSSITRLSRGVSVSYY
ncbi:hypothetical protein KIPB_013491 [Kipferlia bialata]|uniref:Uncharacterized protein n=1 Tax=Kipferlia bialata TaxID=797122 RepID=A0A391NS58_9EUKA|nr:hypothetical protein KIPB_013491 [Kipferlia bialata]|eukprot:g13491.t1